MFPMVDNFLDNCEKRVVQYLLHPYFKLHSQSSVNDLSITWELSSLESKLYWIEPHVTET